MDIFRLTIGRPKMPMEGVGRSYTNLLSGTNWNYK